MFFQCPPVGRRLLYLIPWTFIYKLFIQNALWKENSSKNSHSPRCDGALVCSSRLMTTTLLLMHNFIWIAIDQDKGLGDIGQEGVDEFKRQHHCKPGCS